jgi:glucosamine--fructose-6-phosphate aminotransferase (isomerizing)
LNICTDGSRQSAQYELSKMAVFCASNSGRTKEVVLLAQKLKDLNNTNRFGLSANPDTLLEKACEETFVLTCGWEQAVAATKSVIEQALFYESIIRHIAGTAANSTAHNWPTRLKKPHADDSRRHRVRRRQSPHDLLCGLQ